DPQLERSAAQVQRDVRGVRARALEIRREPLAGEPENGRLVVDDLLIVKVPAQPGVEALVARAAIELQRAQSGARRDGEHLAERRWDTGTVQHKATSTFSNEAA